MCDNPEDELEGLDIMEILRAGAIEDFNTVERRQPERVLMLAILASALQEYAETKGRYVTQWFNSDDDSYVFSFVNICHQCCLDPEALIENMKKVFNNKNGEI